MNFIKNIINTISFFLLLIRINFKDYPIFDILIQNNNSYQIDDTNSISDFIYNTISFKDFDDNEMLYKDFLLLAQSETYCIKNTESAEKILPKFSLVLQILLDAQTAITKLKFIHKSDKKIAYYESSKNSSLDKLIQHFTKKLNLKGEDIISFPLARNEVKLKRFITRLKKRHPLIINFYLALSKMYDFNKINISREDKHLIKGITQMLEFFTLGHATEQQIHKSVAIQIYFIYKDKFTHTNLTTIIGNIIDIFFETESPYSNFESFNQKEAYIKNRVDNFILFDLDDTLKAEQTTKIKYIFEKNILEQNIFYRLPFIKNITQQMINNPLYYILYMEQIKTFGFTPTKK